MYKPVPAASSLLPATLLMRMAYAAKPWLLQKLDSVAAAAAWQAAASVLHHQQQGPEQQRHAPLPAVPLLSGSLLPAAAEDLAVDLGSRAAVAAQDCC